MAQVDKYKRRWYQYSLRSLLLFVLVWSIGCSWLAVKLKKAKRQHAAVAAIEKLCGQVRYDYELDASGGEIPNAKKPWPGWLRDLLGDDFFDSAVEVVTYEDAPLAHVGDLPDLQSLDFYCGIGITDAGLAHLQDVPQLRRLQFGGPDRERATAAGLTNLRFLTRLERLDMQRWLEMTDADVQYLEPLTRLEELSLGRQVTDAGLSPLYGLTRLRRLDLSGTRVTPDGVARLQQALPDCKIIR